MKSRIECCTGWPNSSLYDTPCAIMLAQAYTCRMRGRYDNPTIELSEEAYRRLHERAARLHVTPEQVIERMLASELLPSAVFDDEAEESVPAPGSAEALAAVERLTTLFAAPPIPNIDAVLTDPMLALTNTDLDDLSR